MLYTFLTVLFGSMAFANPVGLSNQQIGTYNFVDANDANFRYMNCSEDNPIEIIAQNNNIIIKNLLESKSGQKFLMEFKNINGEVKGVNGMLFAYSEYRTVATPYENGELVVVSQKRDCSPILKTVSCLFSPWTTLNWMSYKNLGDSQWQVSIGYKPFESVDEEICVFQK